MAEARSAGCAHHDQDHPGAELAARACTEVAGATGSTEILYPEVDDAVGMRRRLRRHVGQRVQKAGSEAESSVRGASWREGSPRRAVGRRSVLALGVHVLDRLWIVVGLPDLRRAAR